MLSSNKVEKTSRYFACKTSKVASNEIISPLSTKVKPARCLLLRVRENAEGVSMTGAVLFKGDNSLDFAEIRSQVLRVPEVLGRIHEAQAIWDEAGLEPVNFYGTMISDNDGFFASSCLKSLCLAIVQVGLYDRYLRKNLQPEFVVGNVRNDSPALVAAGIISFRKLIIGSRAAGVEAEEVTPAKEENGLPTLRGQSLPIFKVYRKLEDGYQEENFESMHIPKVIRRLAEEQCLKRLVSIGPGSVDIQPEERSGMLEEVQFFESIDMDPLLSWFWQNVNAAEATA